MSPDARTQDGTRDNHPESGQLALHEAGLAAGFHALARPEGEDLRIADRTGRVLVDKITPDDAPPRRPEIERTALRRLLLDSLPGGTVRLRQSGLLRLGVHGPDASAFDSS